ncbi:MAG TPA: helix-turn-helix transcriptional regulator [bacterium]|nr:helix-turn-helix transcriptional regulator [bacterium]
MRPEELGSEIRRRRLERGWTLADLARHAGTSAPTVHRYETGWRRFEIGTLDKLAAALGCRLELGLTEVRGRTPAQPGPADLVRQLSRLFWDRRLRVPDLERYPEWVLRRTLEYGSLDDVHALIAYYGRDRFLDLVAGLRLESGRARAFWREILQLEGRECTTRFSREEADASWIP